jgi:hypothetical protein
MPRKAEGLRPLTVAERSARKRQRQVDRETENLAAWRRVLEAKTAREARQIAAEVLNVENS